LLDHSTAAAIGVPGNAAPRPAASLDRANAPRVRDAWYGKRRLRHKDLVPHTVAARDGSSGDGAIGGAHRGRVVAAVPARLAGATGKAPGDR
jgi:hypothetical protein